MKTPIFLIIIIGVLVYSCAPVFSDLQSAKLAGKGNLEVTPGFTTASFSGDGETSHIQDHYGFQVGYGLSRKLDLRARFENIRLDDNSGSANIFGIGPKFSFLEDRIAGFVPIGFAFGGDVDGIDEFEVQPTLLFTLPVGNYIEINPSIKGIISSEFYMAFNLGLGLSTNLDRYVLRPEYGMLFHPGDKGHYGQFSLGATIYFSKRTP